MAPRKILLVEDEDNIALALEFLIKRRGFEMRRAATGTEAIRMLDEDKPDLVLLDVMLPERSGFEICQEIRQSARLRDVKILMMSASGGDMIERKGLALGADMFLTKPFDTSRLTDEICALLGEEDLRAY